MRGYFEERGITLTRSISVLEVGRNRRTETTALGDEPTTGSTDDTCIPYIGRVVILLIAGERAPRRGSSSQRFPKNQFTKGNGTGRNRKTAGLGRDFRAGGGGRGGLSRSLHVAALEASVRKGEKVAENDVVQVTELLMNELLRLDAVAADGDVIKAQRRMQVKRFQKYVETLDAVAAKNAAIIRKAGENKAAANAKPAPPPQQQRQQPRQGRLDGALRLRAMVVRGISPGRSTPKLH